MFFFNPGLNNLELRQIKTSNTISARVVEQLRCMNARTNVTLASFPEIESSTDGEKADSSDPVRKIFTDFYYDAEIGNDKLHSVPGITIDNLLKYRARLSAVSATGEEQGVLISIVDQYTRMIVLHHLANTIIHKTLVAKTQVGYWRDVKSSTRAKLVYGVQSLPYRTYCVVSNVFAEVAAASNSLWSVRRLYNLIIEAFGNVLGKTVDGFSGNFIIQNSKLKFFKVPLGALNEEIKEKIEGLNTLLDDYYRDLGLILNNITEDSNIVSQILTSCGSDIGCQLESIKKLEKDNSKIYQYAPPSFFARYWPILLLLVNYGPSTTVNIWKNRFEIAEWFKLNFFDTVVGFWNNWIVKPIGDMLSILRNDNTMTIASKESLQSDLDSLERMVEEFMKDNHVQVSPEEVHAAVSKGDLTMMMSQYENEIRTPYKSIIKGLLIRSMLIQVQKTKVDGGIAINGIDKLLKLQQLLFGVLSISPSLFILWQGNKALNNKSSLQADLESKRIDCLRSLNQIEKLVNREQTEDKLIGDGKLFVEIINLTLLARSIIPTKLRSEFHHDLNELAMASSDENLSSTKGMINRIWNMYSPYFRR
ncbi:hypothetical protein PUMCH_001614 [Australozyma saopauloensis]|uniref:Nuclear control of ATPase protein 2 n=1 Tax=Australozyma saopauloensis TaxID=291208 RepID=A0AAX4H7G5_9ASCO|nr:hypothetical protein PUMCH_001614 [[Candida] saopauloensis]